LIDIHTHILPFVDDGSDDISSSVEMIKQEIDFGVTDIYLTPHYMKIRNYLSSFEKNKKIFEDLYSELKKQNLKINLHIGNEIYATNKLVSYLKSGKVIPLGNTSYVLIEFSLDDEDYDIGEAINNLVSLGYKPIIAHPERYDYISFPKDFNIMRRMGALIQINAGSIFGQYGKKTKKIALQLLKKDMVDFVASDVHDFRENHLLEAYNYISKKYSNERAEKLFNNPVFKK
jgi:protein-tyrosine phosphatase